MLKALAALAIAAMPVAAGAQAVPPDVSWRVSAGYDSFAFRDVARSKPPVDSAPVEWRGSGPVVTVAYARARPLRLHRFEVSVSSSGGFRYETGVGIVARPADDAATFLDGRYDYRRYLARAILIEGLHAGVGVRGGGGRRVLEHHYGGNVSLTETDVTGSIAIVAALRFRRSGRFSAEAEWGNAATLARGRQHHTADVVADSASWGGGWITDLAARAEVRVATHAAAVLLYAGRGEGLMFDHRAYTADGRRLMAGVTYAR